MHKNMKMLSVHLFDSMKLDKLIDNNDYLQTVLEFIDGRWVVNTEDTRDIELLLRKNRIRFSIKEI